MSTCYHSLFGRYQGRVLQECMHTVDQILQMHGYHEGTEQERLLLVFKDLARARAERTVFDLAIPLHMAELVER